jgi:hypothetical protein
MQLFGKKIRKTKFTSEKVLTFGPAVIDLLDAGASPDEACQKLNICTNSTCNLFSAPSPSKKTIRPSTKQYGDIYSKLRRPNIPAIVWPWERVADHK